MTGDVLGGETRPDIGIGRDDAPVAPAPKSGAAGSGHPLPASGKARHGSLPESIGNVRGAGAN